LRIFGHKRDDIIGGWRKRHNGELHNLYFFPNIIRKIMPRKIGRACSTHGGKKECIWDFGGKGRRRQITRKT
jgi:hypothetical protein